MYGCGRRAEGAEVWAFGEGREWVRISCVEVWEVRVWSQGVGGEGGGVGVCVCVCVGVCVCGCVCVCVCGWVCAHLGRE